QPVNGDLPPHAMRPITAPVAGAGAATQLAQDGGEAVVIEYLRNLREFAQRQQELVLNFLDRDSGTRRVPEAARPQEAVTTPARPDVPKPQLQRPSADPGAPSTPDVKATLLRLVADRTGYPIEMLDLELDLEAD